MSTTDTVVDDGLKLQATMRNLEKFDEAAQKYFRPAMQQATTMLTNAIRPRIPTLTGHARATFGKRITGKGMNLTGYVGWMRGKGKTAWYINVVEYGARPHTLDSGKKQTKKARFYESEYLGSLARSGATAGAGRHVSINGQWRTITAHPGFPARNFLASAYAEKEEAVAGIFGEASDQVLKEIGNGA